MSQFLTPLDAGAAARWTWLAFGGLGALTLARVIALGLSEAQLYPDEAQYWGWAQSLSFGYFSKPPLIAWMIALTTGLLGDTEFGVRIAAPFLHAGAAAGLFVLGRRLADARIGAVAGLIYALSPAVWISSGVMSTDALLLPCWTLALLAAWRLSDPDGPSFRAAILLGAALGVGLLAKYAMAYAIIALALWAGVDRDARRGLLSRAGALAAVVAAMIVAPNIAWNAANRFATLAHTAGDANWGGREWGLATLTEFVVAQFAVFGPFAFAALLAGLGALAWRGRRPDRREAFLLCFTAPPLVLITANAFLSPANANWAATAYPAASVLVALWLVAWGKRLWLGAIAVFGMGFGGLLVFAVTNFAAVDAWGWNNAVKRVRAWDVTTEQIAIAAARGAGGAPFEAVVFDMRFPYHEAAFYGRDHALPALRMWRRFAGPRNHAEQTASLAPGAQGPVLVVVGNPRTPPILQDDFARLAPVGEIVTDLGPGRSRRFELFAGWGYAPKPRDAAFDARWKDVVEEADTD